MKLAKYIVIAVAVVATIAAIGWSLRDNLIQRLSNPLLARYQLAVVDVSLDALAGSDASISYLELQHEKGTTIVIEGLTLPYAAASKKLKTYRAEKVSVVTATRTDGTEFDIAELVQQVLSLQNNLVNSIFIVEAFSLPPYPVARELRWEILDPEQRLSLSIEAVDLSLTLKRADPDGHDVAFSLSSTPADRLGKVLNAHLREEASHVSLTGDGALDLPAWQPLAELVGIIPPDIDVVSGTAALTFDVAVPKDAAQTSTLSAMLTPTSPMAISYRTNDGDIATVNVQSARSANLSATFPDLDWSLELAEAEMTVSYGSWKHIPLSLTDTNCSPGPTCATNARVSLKRASLPPGRVESAEFSAAANLQFMETGLHVDLPPGASLGATNLAAETTAVKRLQARLVSGATLQIQDDGWRITADSVDAEIDGFSLGEAASISMPLFLESVLAEENLGELSLAAGVFAPSSRALWDERSIVLPGYKGEALLNGSELAADLRTVGLKQDAAIQARHSFATGAGRVSFTEAAISFAKKKLSGRISPWPRDRDIVAGTVTVGLSASWASEKSGLRPQLEADMTATGIAGFLGETAITGFSSELRGTYLKSTGFSVQPSTLSIALVDVGVPLEEISAAYSLDLNTLSADITELRMSAFGSTITADPFSFRTAGDVNTVILKTETLDLAKLLALKGFEAVEVTGSVTARLPITFQGDLATIEHGQLTGNAPGGVIRYKPGRRPDKSDTSSLGFAKRVLSNFEYTTLASDVNLNKQGDLMLKLSLTGRNPDMEEKRPVVLNINVDNNIPQMLRSLRAARAVEDVLEQRLGK